MKYSKKQQQLKKTVLLFLILLASVNICLAQEWMTSLDVAKRLAKVQNKMLFVMWEASLNYPYPITVDDNKGDFIITNLNGVDSINRLIWKHFVPVKLSEDMYAELYNRIKLIEKPKYLSKLNDDGVKIMDINGNILNTAPFYASDDVLNLSLFIKMYALNTTFLKQALINYSKHKNFISSQALASKYVDYALFVEKQIIFEIVEMANIYFKEAKWHLEKSNLKYKDAYFQRLVLLNIKEKLILRNPKKAKRLLKRIKLNEIDKKNESFFSFLNYTTFKLLGNKEKAMLWKSKVSLLDLKRTELIININK